MPQPSHVLARMTRSLAARLCVGLAACGSLPAAALDPHKPFHDYVRNTWSVEQGLPQLTVSAIAQDRPGYLWFGTQAGLARFDGVRFVTYDMDTAPELPGTMIRALHVDPAGRLWIGTPQGLAVREGTRFRRVAFPGDGSRAYEVYALASLRGGVYAATSRGLYRVDGAAPERVARAPDAPRSLLAQGDALWIGAAGQACRMQANRFDCRPLPAEAAAASVDRLAAAQGRLWAGTREGLFRLDGSWQRHEQAPSLARAPIEAMLADHDANLWVATPAALIRVRDGREAERIEGGEVLQSLYEDREHNLWLGSAAEGVSRLWNGWTRRYSSRDGLANRLLWSVAQGSDGSIWAGSNDGLVRFDHGRFRTLVRGRELPHPAVYSLLPEEDAVWIGTRAGAALWRHGRLQPLPALEAMRGAQVNGILRDRHGQLWFATARGLYRLDARGRMQRYAEEQGLPDPRVRVLHETRDGTLLVGTQNGLYRWDGTRLHAAGPDPAIGQDLHVTAIHELPGGQWVLGTLTHEDLLIGDHGHWTRLGRNRGVPLNAAFFISHDDDYLWVAGLRGIYRAPIADLLHAIHDPAQRVAGEMLLNERGERHGGQKGDCCNGAGNSRGFVRDRGLWLPSRDGLVVLQTDQAARNDHAPTTVIERVQVAGRWIVLDPRGDTGALSLPAGARDLKFEFTTLSFQAADHVDIRYRLRGYDTQWRTLDTPEQRSVAYTNLPPGNYRFEASGSNNSGIASHSQAGLAFKVPAYFHETPWFHLLLTSLIACVVYAGYRLLRRRYASQRAFLEYLVQKRTQDLQLLNQRLQDMSLTDYLTGLRNRRYLAQQIPADLSFYQRDPAFQAGNDAVVFVLLDVDHFKSINDGHGHAAGDRILQQLAELLQSLVRGGDYVARWGGEEFLLAFRPMPRAQVSALGDRLLQAIERHAFDVGDGRRYPLTVSAGLVEYPLFPQQPQLLGWEQLITLADHALYWVKEHGRSNWALYRAAAHAPASPVTLDSSDPVELVARGLLVLESPALRAASSDPAPQ